MPVNRVLDDKAKLYWLQLLNFKSNNKGEVKVPDFIPGLLLFPIPEAGRFLGYVDIAFWAAFLYVAGSVVYVFDSLLIWPSVGWEKDDDDTLAPTAAGNVLNLVAALIFIINALFCFVDWWLQRKQLSFMNITPTEDDTGEITVAEVSNKLSMYYFWNNVFFLGAAVIYMIQGIWWENPTSDLLNCSESMCGMFWVNFWGSALYFISGLFALLESVEDRRIRRMRNLRPLQFFCTDPYELDWFGWGDIMYFASGLLELIQACLIPIVLDDDQVSGSTYFTYNVVFLIDSMLYLVGYCYYVLEIRKTLLTGYLNSGQVALLNNLVTETTIPKEAWQCDVFDETSSDGEVFQSKFEKSMLLDKFQSRYSLVLETMDNPDVRASLQHGSNIDSAIRSSMITRSSLSSLNNINRNNKNDDKNSQSHIYNHSFNINTSIQGNNENPLHQGQHESQPSSSLSSSLSLSPNKSMQQKPIEVQMSMSSSFSRSNKMPDFDNNGSTTHTNDIP